MIKPHYTGGIHMEFLLEIILELVLEGTSELIKSKKASLWVRIPAACLFLAIYIGIAALFLFIAVKLWKTLLPLSLIMLSFICIFTLYLIYFIRCFIKTHA
jgi:hypothetical protein